MHSSILDAHTGKKIKFGLIHLFLFTCYFTPTLVTSLYNDAIGPIVVNFIGSCFGSIHIGYVFAFLLCNKLKHFNQLVCFYQRHIRLLLCGVFAFLLNILYYETLFCKVIVSENSYPFKGKMLTSSLLVIGYTTFVNATFVLLCFFLFTLHHKDQFKKIIEYERAITFNGILKQTLEITEALGYQTLNHFVCHWRNKTDAEILEAIDRDKLTIFGIFKQFLDKNDDNSISYTEFAEFAKENGVSDIDGLWSFFTQHRPESMAHRQKIGTNMGTKIPEVSIQIVDQESENTNNNVTNYTTTNGIDRDINTTVIEFMLYHKLFQKQQLANAIQTDSVLASWIVKYIHLFFVPLVAIILSGVWGYTNAFHGNFSLFQLYIAVATFISNNLIGNIRFIGYMTLARPFNIGELLYMDDDVYKITKLNPTFITCQGKDTIILRNSQMVDKVVHNYSRSNIVDSCVFDVPLNSPDEVVNIVHNKMLEYATIHWKEIDPQSVKCGWAGVNGQGKTIRCVWRYNFLVYDRSKFNGVRLNFINSVLSATIDHISNCTLLINASQCTNALNDAVVQHYDRLKKNL